MLSVDAALYLITDRCQTLGRPLSDVVRRALDGGVRLVQLREKDLADCELCRLAAELRRITADYSAALLINSRPDIAVAVQADGVHVGVSGIPLKTVRETLGRERIIGYSAHSGEEALMAQSEGADFVTFGPVFQTPSKAMYGAPAGVKKLAETARLIEIPVFALGGISLTNIDEALAANPAGIAVISAIMSAADPTSASAALLEKIRENGRYP